MQQLIMQGLPAMYLGVHDATGKARDYYSDVLEGDYDPFTGPRASAMRGELEFMKRRALTQANQEASSLGGLTSTPAAGVRSNIRGQYDRITASQLAALSGEERDRKERAAVSGPQVERGAIGAAGELAALADVERQINQARQDAIFTAAMKSFLLPFQEISNIAMGLMNYQMPVVVTGGGLTDAAYAANIASNLFGGWISGGGLGGGGGGGGGGTAVVGGGGSGTFSNPQAVYGAPQTGRTTTSFGGL
jgi:hypothetical protein